MLSSQRTPSAAAGPARGLPTIPLRTAAGPVALDLDRDPARGPVGLRARGRLLLPDGPLDLVLDDLATVDLASGTVAWDRLRLHRSLRLGHGPQQAVCLGPVLLDRLEDALGEPSRILEHARAVAGRGVREDGPAPRRFERRAAHRI